MLRIAVVEDEREASQLLAEYLCRYQRETGLLFQVNEFRDADSFLQGYKNDYDIVFMDVNMPGTNGMQASHRLRELDETVVLIFVTSLAQYAVEGYEVNALDFVLKPLNYYSFKLKIKRAVSAARRSRPAQLVIQCENGTQYIDADALMYVEVNSHSLLYHTQNGIVQNTGTLKQVESHLDEDRFFRCNYCYLVNLSHVTGIQGSTVTVGGDELQISRNRKKEFMQKLTRFYGKGGR